MSKVKPKHWDGMKGRCRSIRAKQYYKDRGIVICKGWLNSFLSFYHDVGPKPFEGATIDRKDNDGGYWCGHCDECIANGWPMNVRWATRKQQLENRRPRSEWRNSLNG